MRCSKRRKIFTRSKSKDSEDSKDVVEQLFARAFGERALLETNPFGMRRLDVETCPEAFGAAPKDAVAMPLDGDEPLVQKIRPLLARTQLEKRALVMAYDAEVDGWNPEAFHRKVDGRGPAVVLLCTRGGVLCGGYNPKGWIGLGDNRSSLAAFLFRLDVEESQHGWNKLQKIGGDSLAVCDQADTGPVFGADALVVSLKEPNPREAKCRLGAYYERLPDGSRNLFAAEEKMRGGGGKAELVSLQVLVAEGKGEEWELDGIVWKTSLD